MEKRAHKCCHGKEYGANLQGDVVIGCAEDNIWCTDSTAEKCPLYVDKDEPEYCEAVRRLHRVERTDFTIISRPVEITFVCPHCEVSQEISWKDLDVPEYWGGDWGEVECPTCGKVLELGDYDYDY